MICLPVEPGGDPFNPVPDVVGGILEQPACLLVVGKEPEKPRKKQKKRLRAVMDLRFSLVSMVTFSLNPSTQQITKIEKMLTNRFTLCDEVVGKPGQHIISFVFPAAVPAGRIHAPTLVDPAIHLLAKLETMMMAFPEGAHQFSLDAVGETTETIALFLQDSSFGGV